MRNTNRYPEGDYGQPRSRRKHHPKAYLKSGSFSRGFFWGAVIGGILGILFAPDKGENTRKKLKKTAEEYQDKGKKALEKAKIEMESAREKYEEIKIKTEPIIEKAREKMVDIKEIVEEKKDPILDTLGDFAENIEDGAKKIKKRYFSGVRKK